MNSAEILTLAKELGFSHAGPLDPATIELKDEVRAMCNGNSCGRYGKCWSCPPACGTLDECRKHLMGFTRGILVQTTGELEDSFDIEGIEEAQKLHKEHFDTMHKLLEPRFARLLALGAGSCTRCRLCTYPDAPCRFPRLMVSSMEAYGMLVLEVCRKNNLPYYYGPNTITYTGCFLFE